MKYTFDYDQSKFAHYADYLSFYKSQRKDIPKQFPFRIFLKQKVKKLQWIERYLNSNGIDYFVDTCSSPGPYIRFRTDSDLIQFEKYLDTMI